MDADFWAARLAAAKRQYAFQNHQLLNSHLDRFNMDDFEMEEEGRAEIPCPYCYEEFDIVSLCAHLEDEHSCESKPAACPVCSSKVSRDMLSHITHQHAQLFKLHRRRRLRRVALPNSQTLSLLGRDLREAHLQVLLSGAGGIKSSNSTSSSASNDPLLSSLIMNYPSNDASEAPKSTVPNVEEPSEKHPSSHIWKSSIDSSMSYEERQKKMKQAVGRANFVQDLLFSTIMGD